LFAYEHPEALAKLIDLLVDALAGYLVRQFKAGVDAVYRTIGAALLRRLRPNYRSRLAVWGVASGLAMRLAENSSLESVILRRRLVLCARMIARLKALMRCHMRTTLPKIV